MRFRTLNVSKNKSVESTEESSNHVDQRSTNEEFSTNEATTSTALNPLKLSKADIEAIKQEVVSQVMEVFEPLLKKLGEAAEQQKQEQGAQATIPAPDVGQQQIQMQAAMDDRLKMLQHKVAKRMQKIGGIPS